MKRIFTKKFWLIKRANLRLTKFKYFYNWQNTLKLIFAFGFVLPLAITFILIPKWFFDKLDDVIRDNMPQCFKVDENPEWTKQGYTERQNFMNSLKDWD